MKPRRSILSIPGHIEKMHQKAALSSADVVMLDLEDSVPLPEKESARKIIINSIKNLDWQNKIVTFRINPVDSKFAWRDIIEVVEAAGEKIDSLVIPKVNHPGDIHFVSRLLDGIEQNINLSKKIGIEASIETAQGLENVSKIAKASERIQTLVFGIADYSESIGVNLVSLSGHGENEENIYPGHRWHYPLSLIVMTAKANGLQAIDAPYGNFKNTTGLEKSSQISRALGCDGKWAIHPDQIETINEVYSPTKEDMQFAAKIIAANEKAQNTGQGAIAVEGRMIDQATVRLAKQLYEKAKYLKLIK